MRVLCSGLRVCRAVNGVKYQETMRLWGERSLCLWTRRYVSMVISITHAIVCVCLIMLAANLFHSFLFPLQLMRSAERGTALYFKRMFVCSVQAEQIEGQCQQQTAEQTWQRGGRFMTLNARGWNEEHIQKIKNKKPTADLLLCKNANSCIIKALFLLKPIAGDFSMTWSELKAAIGAVHGVLRTSQHPASILLTRALRSDASSGLALGKSYANIKMPWRGCKAYSFYFIF